MNTTTNFYKGLTNDDTIDDLTVGSCNCGTFNVNSITASHYYGIITEVINTSMLFPEIGFSFDPAVNTFSIYLYYRFLFNGMWTYCFWIFFQWV